VARVPFGRDEPDTGTTPTLIVDFTNVIPLASFGGRRRLMAHVKDEGVFDAPLDKIWKYLQDSTPGVHAHKAIRGMKPIEEKGNATTVEMEMVNPDGKSTRKETWRFVYNPPHGFEMEALAGASKGTKYSHRYTAMGNRTRVEVEGDFHIQGMDEASTRQAALGFLSAIFDEDQASLGRYR
jgi:Polyketide cyclase / dehydrase and lipid transport